MKNRQTVTIAGQDFTLIAEESTKHMNAVAARVDQEIRQIADSFNGSSANIAVLACINLADALLKTQENNESLRGQIKEYLEESTKMKAEAADMRRTKNK